MGRAPCCSKVGMHRGPWTVREDELLVKYIQEHGEGHWRILPRKAGLLRCGKSCRLRWMNYLRPDIKRGNITPEEDDLILRLHSLLGNRWSLIAGRLPGRTDNEIKNYWNTHLSRRVKNNAGTSDHKHRRESINRNNSNKKQQKKQQKKGGRDSGNANTKIHHPKAVKASPFSATRKVSTQSILSGSTSHAGAGDTEANKDRLAWVTDSDIHVAHDNDYSSQNYVPGSEDYIVDGIYEEYQQLIRDNELAQLDSFIDSLLA